MDNQIIDTTAIIKHAKNIVTQFTIKETDVCTLIEFDHLRITDKTSIPYPIPVLKINGEIISTPEALTVISGQPKSGKSALCGILIASSITTNNDIDGLRGVEILPNLDGKAVIHFDTEQARWKQQFNLKTILKRANLISCPDFYLSYNIRKLEIDKYQSIVNSICDAALIEFKGIHSIWIDGGADFIYDTNDQAQSNNIIKYFDGLAQIYHTSIFIVVHTNPGSNKERGHFGSQCQRKAEGILLVQKEGDISFLDPKLLRHAGDVPKIQFQYDREKGYHVECNVVVDLEKRKEQAKIDSTRIVCEEVFSGQRSYSYENAIDKIMVEINKSISIAKGYFTTMKAHGWIVQGSDKNWRLKNENTNEINEV